MSRKPWGFTLIELMIACAVVAILAAIAVPSYTRHVQKSNRTAAKAQMMDLANRQQQYFLSNKSYAANMTALNYTLPSTLNGVYTPTITVGSGTVPAYTITFTPQGSQAADGTLTLNSEGVKAPADKW